MNLGSLNSEMKTETNQKKKAKKTTNQKEKEKKVEEKQKQKNRIASIDWGRRRDK